MVPSSNRAALTALMQSQRAMEDRTRTLGHSPVEVLEVGEDVLAFAAREDEAFASLTDLIDPAVRAELAAEHQHLAEDLDLLAWLLRTSPDSPDVEVLAEALARRMRQHLERDGRLLARTKQLLTPHS
jgi:hypothetical protein